jgi:hypothetical protein
MVFENMNRLDQLAAAVSAILSPFVVFIVTVLLMVRPLATTPNEAVVWSLISILFASVLPFLFVFVLVRLGVVEGMHIVVREQRAGPLLFMLACGFCGTLVLYRIGAARALILLGVSYFMVGVVFTLITLFWKISFHSGVLATSIVSLALVVSVKLLFLILLVPLLVWARIYRKRHTLLQNVVAVSIAIGITVVIFQSPLFR